MIPYLQVGVFRLGPVILSPSRVLIVVALLTGYFLLMRRSRRLGLDERVMAGFTVAIVAAGFLFGHWFKYLYWEDGWQQIRENPMRLLNLLYGQASMGGLLGALLGGWLWLKFRGDPRTGFIAAFDALAYVFPPVWIIARLQCVLTHDHPGLRTDHWLGVAYPDGLRYDLAVLELIFLLFLWAGFVLLARIRPPEGTFFAAVLGAYGTFRIWLDGFHVDPPRYLGWPVDRWAGAAMILGSILLIGFLWRRSARGREARATGGGQKWAKASSF